MNGREEKVCQMTHFLRKPKPRPLLQPSINEKLLIHCVSLETKPPLSRPTGRGPRQHGGHPQPRTAGPAALCPDRLQLPPSRASASARGAARRGRSRTAGPQTGAGAVRGGAGLRGSPAPRVRAHWPAISLPARPASGRPAPNYGRSPARHAPARTGARARLPAGRGVRTARGAGLGGVGPARSAAPAPSACLPARPGRVGPKSLPLWRRTAARARRLEILSVTRSRQRPGGARTTELGERAPRLRGGRKKPRLHSSKHPGRSLRCPTPFHRSCPPPAAGEPRSTREGPRRGEGLCDLREGGRARRGF